MKKILAALLCAITLISCASCAANVRQNDPSASAKSWIESKIKDNKLFSFEYNGEKFADFIGKWDKKSENSTDSDGNTVYNVSYTAPDGLVVSLDATLYADTAAVDWIINFENGASADSGVISNIHAMDASLDGRDMSLTYANGSNANEYDFTPVYEDFGENATVELTAQGGRSSSGIMPYFDLHNGDGGVIAAIGWTGQWGCNITKTDKGVSLTAGMVETRIALYAGEKMRTPSMVLMFYSGDTDAGHNAWRSLILGHYCPKDDDGSNVTELSMFSNAWGSAGEKSIMSKITTYDTSGVAYDGVWMDAGWHGKHASVDTYDSTWATEVGNWYVNTEIYPNTLKVIGDALVERDKEFLLWFEPERVVAGTDLFTEHPDYMFPMTSAATWTLYDLTNDEATDYLINLISGIISENGITWYRQDFNCEPLGKWAYYDQTLGENRVGISEIKYITNLYRYLDALLEQNPGLMMDNCASGGKRLDIEMMKRSVPMWRTDYTVNGSDSTADGVRNINMNLSYWIPLHCGGNGTDGMDDSYEFRSMLSSGLTVGTVTGNRAWFDKMFEQYYRARPLMTADYYILAQGEGDRFDDENAAYMYYGADKGEGYLMLFRTAGSTVADQTYKLKGLDAGATYLLEDADSDTTLTATGAELMEKGLAVTMAQLRSSRLIWITKQ